MDGRWPSDILIEILMKLPVKSIIRFKCVAKTWCRLFQNPSFISQHFDISKKNKRLVVYHRDNNNVVIRLFVDQALVFFHDLQPPSHFASIDFFEFCVDNGLFCLLDPLNSVLALWNPATREFKILPECNQNILSKVSTLAENFGFGLDPLSNDYKVVYIREYLDSETNMREPNKYAIYNMSSDSWREFKETMNNEVFQLIDSPFPKRGGRLLPLHGRIAIWDTDLLEDIEISNEVWLLDDDGRHWTKVLKIEIPVLQVKKLFGFWKNGKVLVESATAELLLYDLEKEEVQTRVGGEFYYVHTYEESLVAIEKQ
ncbi:hypothetical protein PTKIN_Ptkin03bG0021000 [Pterospermum kingtungense]